MAASSAPVASNIDEMEYNNTFSGLRFVAEIPPVPETKNKYNYQGT